MPENEFIYKYNDKEYPVIVTRKSIRSIRYTFRDGKFYVSAPHFFAGKGRIIDGLDRFAARLIKSDHKSKARGEDYIYLLGTKVQIQNEGEINFSDGVNIKYKSAEDLDKKLKKWFLKLVENRHRYYEKLMEIKKPYKVKVRKMSSRYGSNSSQTHSITYSLILMHYTIDVIDSVIVHELVHDKVHNHSNKFYDVVYKYCPDYDKLHKRLRKGEFQ